MSESSRDFESLISTWVAATQNVDIPALPNEETMERYLLDLRSRLRDGTWRGLNLKADDQGLAVLSRLSFELSKCSVSDDSLCEAAAAHELVSGLTWPADLPDEQDEILSQLALVAWRKSRQFGTTRTMLAWEKKYRTRFSRPSADRAWLEHFLAIEPSKRSQEMADLVLSDIPAIFGLCELLRTTLDSCPAKTATEASILYEWISKRGQLRFENEKNYFLGMLALLAGSGHRVMGQREPAAKWFDRAHHFLSTLRNPEPELARLAYGRLTLLYEIRHVDVVLRDMPSLLVRFQELGLEEEETKCLFVEAMALKESGQPAVALAKFLALEQRLVRSDPCRLLGGVVTRIGELYSVRGWHHKAMEMYQRAFPLICDSGRPHLIADLKATVGETCRDMGDLETAIELDRGAISDYAELSVVSLAAYLRIVLAETLLLAGRPREAEIEIRAALPTIEAEQMAHEGLAALKLLRTSLDRSKLDAASLRALRESLKGDRQ